MLKWTSVSGNIIQFAFGRVIIPILNESIVAEYREVLMREKFHFTKVPYVVTPKEMLDIFYYIIKIK